MGHATAFWGKPKPGSGARDLAPGTASRATGGGATWLRCVVANHLADIEAITACGATTAEAAK